MMRLLFSFIVFFAVTLCAAAEEVVIDFAHPMFAQLDAEGKELLSEYAKVYPQIKNFYENMRMDVNVKKTSYPSEKSLESLRSVLRSKGLGEDEIKDMAARSGQTDMHYEVRYRQPDGYARVDTMINHRVTNYARSKLPPGSPLLKFSAGDVVQDIGVVLLTPTMGYRLSKSDPLKQYYSLNIKRDMKSPDSKDDIGLSIIYFDTAPFSSNDTPLEEIVFRCPPLIKGKPYIVEYVRQKEIDGEQVVEIRTSRADFTDTFREIKLDRNSWCVKEIYCRTGLTLSSGEEEVRWYREACTYGGIVDGMPLLKTYRMSFGKYDKNAQEDKIIGQMSCEVTNLIPGPPDLSEFDVAQFLPPGIKIGKDISPAHFSPIRIAAIVIGLTLFILGIYMRLRRART